MTVSLKLDLNEDANLFELGVNSSFYANLASNVRNEIFSVSLEGAFQNRGVYGVKQGERLSKS